MIQLLRVDHRLLHGQVVFSWCTQLKPNCILVADDKVVHDEVRKAALRLAKPSETKLVFKNLKDSIESINSGVTDKYRLLIVVSNVLDAVTLAKECDQIKSINLGGTKANENTHALSNMVNLTDEEESMLKDVCALGKEVFLQGVPSDMKKEYK